MIDPDLSRRFVVAAGSVLAVQVGRGGHILWANDAFASRIGTTALSLEGEALADFLADPDADRLGKWLAGTGLPDGPFLINFATPSGSLFTLRCAVGRAEGTVTLVGEPDLPADRGAAEELMRLNNELATMARERARRERELDRTRRRLESTVRHLKESYWHLRKIQEVLPVCMHCGKVKSGDAEWSTVVEYLKANEIFLSHGYCPECADRVLSEVEAEDQGGTP